MNDDGEGTTSKWPWFKRGYQRGDADIVVSLWVEEHARTAAAARHRARDRDGFWREHTAIIEALLDRATTMVLVDARDIRIVWAFACWSPGVVHFAAVKSRYAEFKTEMLADLLGEQFHAPLRYSYVIPQLRPMPANWDFDPHCLPEILRQPSLRRAKFLENADAIRDGSPSQAGEVPRRHGDDDAGAVPRG